MKPDPYNCRHDYEHELDGEAQRAAHEAGECKGQPFCDHCVEEILNQEEIT